MLAISCHMGFYAKSVDSRHLVEIITEHLLSPPGGNYSSFEQILLSSDAMLVHRVFEGTLY